MFCLICRGETSLAPSPLADIAQFTNLFGATPRSKVDCIVQKSKISDGL